MDTSESVMKSSSSSTKSLIAETSSSSLSSSVKREQSLISNKNIQTSIAIVGGHDGGTVDFSNNLMPISPSPPWDLSNKVAMLHLGDDDKNMLVDCDKNQEETALSSSTSVIKQSSTSLVASSITSVEEEKDAAEKTVIDAPTPTAASAAPTTTITQQQITTTSKQENFNNTIKEIMTDIDTNIKEQENIAILKQQEVELIKKQQELAKQIQQQQLLAQQLASENELKQKLLQRQEQLHQQQQQQQQLELQQQQQMLEQNKQLFQPQKQPQQQEPQQQKVYQPQKNISKYSTYEEKKDENGYTRTAESFETEESSNVSKTVDLRKIFTPATDALEILPKNRKLYASSAFYSPSLHPTVEDQVELARRISHSLSDISNQTSKGQTMYVNRKKRSVKWVHEGSGQGKADECQEFHGEYKENGDKANKLEDLDTTAHTSPLNKLPLRLIMNPRGQMRDYNSLRESINTQTGLLSPDNCAELISALQTQKGKGAELFAKRRRKAEKWVVDETNAGTQSPSGIPDYQQYQPRPATSPSILPAYSDAGKHRVQLNMHQDQCIEKYARPGLKVVKTPWEAALETGSASTAFVDMPPARSPQLPTSASILSPAPAPQYYDSNNSGSSPYTDVTHSPVARNYGYQYGEQQHKLAQTLQYSPTNTSAVNPQRDLAYKPSIPQGWKATGMDLPRSLYVPKEIPLESYAPPPTASSSSTLPATRSPTQNYSPNWSPNHQVDNNYVQQPYMPISPSKPSAVGFPLTKPANVVRGFSTSASEPPKQQLFAPNSYQKVSQTISQNTPPVNFNPSPLSYDKLLKFENADPVATPRSAGVYSPHRHLNVRGSSKVRNASPIPFGGGSKSPTCYTPSSHTAGNFGVSVPKPTRPLSGLHGGDAAFPSSASYTKSCSSSSRFSTGDLLHGQTFNKSARGWRAGGADGATIGQKFGQHDVAVAINTGSMPYTDF